MKTFKIRLTQEILFIRGLEKETLLKGTILEATAFTGHYYVTSKGGIWKDEAEIVE